MVLHADNSILQERSGEIEHFAGELEDLVGRTTSKINGLESEWTGMAAQSFIQQWADLLPTFNKAHMLLSDISMQLSKAGEAFEQLDHDVAGAMGI